MFTLKGKTNEYDNVQVELPEVMVLFSRHRDQWATYVNGKFRFFKSTLADVVDSLLEQNLITRTNAKKILEDF